SWVDRTMEGFDVVATVPLSLGPDPVAAADPVRNFAALYLGGMGSRKRNFYLQQAARMGFQEQARQVQELFLGKQYSAAAAAVPYDFIDQTALLGDAARLSERMQEFAEAGVTTLAIMPMGRTLEDRITDIRTAAEVAERAGL
ncbi:MAG TPA: LLM class flavin-dependent oxidoreductase, partial [Mycobacteriales bacterium]|nr:LLM class flavin-dependent oxidoreductase [Mycobacteriales bacterium]